MVNKVIIVISVFSDKREGCYIKKEAIRLPGCFFLWVVRR